MAQPEEEHGQTSEVDGEELANENADSEKVSGEKTESENGEGIATSKTDEGVESSPEESLEEILAELDRHKDLALRSEAEMQNMQRRTARDVENAHKFGVERLLQNLLPVVDSLEKAIESAEQAGGGAEEAIAEGVVLCHKLLLDVLDKEKIEVIDPIGEPFDPNEHQAMSMVENLDMEPNSVFAVVQKGYKLNGRLVRAAMVMVSKAPASQVDDVEEPAADS